MECIDEGLTYCANANYSGGYCCEPTEDCPRAQHCSTDNPRAPPMFNYMVCPNEAACESKKIYPKYSGEVLTRAVDKYTYAFVQNDVCGYIIHAPWEMQSWDRMRMRISKIENADVYVAKSRKFKWFNHLDRMASNGDLFDTRSGWQFYVVGVSKSVFKGTFRMQIWIERGVDPNAAAKAAAAAAAAKKKAAKFSKTPTTVYNKTKTKATIESGGVKAIPIVKQEGNSTTTVVAPKKEDKKAKLKKDVEAMKAAEIKAQNAGITDAEVKAVLADKDV